MNSLGCSVRILSTWALWLLHWAGYSYKCQEVYFFLDILETMHNLLLMINPPFLVYEPIFV